MVKTYGFLMTHFGSGYEFLREVLNNHPKIAAIQTNFIYEHATDIISLYGACYARRASNEYKRIFMDCVVLNQGFACPRLLKGNKFIYVIRRPEPTLSELIGSGAYDAESATNYYCFRLQRLSQFSKVSGGILLNWDDIAGQGGFRLVENYLDLKQTLSSRGETLKRTYDTKVPEQYIRTAERAYEKYITRIKQRTESR